jgi:hypothetical protein
LFPALCGVVGRPTRVVFNRGAGAGTRFSGVVGVR